MIILLYTVLVGSYSTSNRVELSSLSECLKEKDRIEQYYLSEYQDQEYSIETRCEFYGR